MSSVCRWLAACATLTLAQAQSFSVPDANAASGSCDAVPFGGSSHWSNQRMQFVVPSASLGNARAAIQGIAFAPCGTGIYQHARLRVVFAHVPSGQSLSSTFATNLGAAVGTPVTVLDATGHAWQARQNQWSEIGIARRFDYDGVSDLLIEVEARGSSYFSNGPGNPGMRSTVGRSRVAFNRSSPWATPPAVGSLSTLAPKVQIRASVASSSVHGGGCNGVTLGFRGVPSIGGSFDVQLSGAPPFSVAIGVLGYTVGPPYPISLGILGLPQCSLRTDPIAEFSRVAADLSGTATATMAVPNDAGVAGLRFFAQWAVVDYNFALLGVSNFGRIVLGP